MCFLYGDYAQLKIIELLRLCTTLGEVSKTNYQFSLWYVFINSYAYHKQILFIPQIMILYYVYLKGTIITLYNIWLE